MKTVSIDYFGASGSGRNVTEAKKDAGRKIERVMRDRRPRLVTYSGKRGEYASVIYADADGWMERTIHDPDGFRDAGSLWGNWAGDDATEAAHSVLWRFVVDDWRVGDDPAFPDLPASARGALGITPTRWLSRMDDWIRNVEFLTRYADAQSRGMSDNDARDYALRNPARRDLWEAA